jgi:hypothetical protein
LYSAGKVGLKEAITAHKASIVTWESRGQEQYTTSIKDYMENKLSTSVTQPSRLASLKKALRNTAWVRLERQRTTIPN